MPHRCRERTLPLPRYGLPDKTGISVWVETRRSGDRHGIEYEADRDGTATLQVITSMLPGPDPRTLLGGDSGEPLTVQAIVDGESVSFHGTGGPDAWAVRADFTGYCLAVVGIRWPAVDLALVPVNPPPPARGTHVA